MINVQLFQFSKNHFLQKKNLNQQADACVSIIYFFEGLKRIEFNLGSEI